ncbi:hypothetical protein PWT90_09061 [Aphanocladium album]|nr:hypothetical protein PWT90_09061 [Aphanocladium album]
MGLLELPLELFEMVAKHTMPYGIETLALTCKQLQQWAEPLLPKHNHLRKKWRNFSFSGHEFNTISELLAEIATEPIIAAYMVHVDLDGRECRREVDDDCIEMMSNKLSALVLGSPYLAILSDGYERLDTLWLREIARDVEYRDAGGDEKAEFGIPFLMSLLVNVESLILPDNWCKESLFTDPESATHPVTALMQLLVMRANDASLKSQPLQRLRAILPTKDVDEQHGTDIERLFPLLALDSMRELSHSYGVCMMDQSINAPFTTLCRNVETIKLEDYVVDGQCARFLFKNARKLRVLEMDYSMKDETGYQFDANRFMEHLMTGTSKNLEALTLTGQRVFPDTDCLDRSLRDFTRLKYLKLSTVFLVNGAGAMGPDYRGDGSETEQEEESDEEVNGSDGEGDEHYDGEDEEQEDEGDDGEDGENSDEQNDDEQNDDGEEQEAEEDDKGDVASRHDGEDQVVDDYDIPSEFPPGKTWVRYDDGEMALLLCGEYHPDDDTKEYTNGRTVWRLVSVLPESLETLVIDTPAAPRNSACVERMFWRFEELRAERLPNLARITVRVLTRDFWGHKLEGCDEQVQRLRDFFADKHILTEFAVF